MIATARRVLLQLGHDPRTVGMLVAVPAVLLALLRYVFNSAVLFGRIAPALLAIFPFLMMFLVTSITTLRERTSGTLERLMTTPLAKLDLLLGYALAFGLVALVQVAVATVTTVSLGMPITGSPGWLIVVTVADALLGVALGLLASAFAASEFQAIQFMPVVVLPQVLLCGLFQPRAGMADPLRWVSAAMPMSYAVEALQRVAVAAPDERYAGDLGVVAAFAIAALVLAAATLRRRTR